MYRVRHPVVCTGTGVQHINRWLLPLTGLWPTALLPVVHRLQYRYVLRSTDLLESTGGFSLGGFSSLCCYAALGWDHHLALPAGASAFAVAEFIVAVDSVDKFQDQPGCQRPLPARVLGLRLRAAASVSRPLIRAVRPEARRQPPAGGLTITKTVQLAEVSPEGICVNLPNIRCAHSLKGLSPLRVITV